MKSTKENSKPVELLDNDQNLDGSKRSVKGFGVY